METNLLLVRRDRGLALRIRLNYGGGQSGLAGDKGQDIGEQFQGLLVRKASGEAHGRVSDNTAGKDFTSPQAHLDAIRRFKEVVG